MVSPLMQDEFLMQYLLDANTFIQAKNQYYAMDICPGYWDWLEQENGLGRLGSISEIARELKRQDDELSCWVKERDKPDFFLPVDDRQTQEVYAQIANYVVQHFEEKHFAPFLGVADPWLVAKAKTTGAVLVTHEALVPANSKKVKIPNICQHFFVQYISTFSLLRRLEARFTLQASS